MQLVAPRIQHQENFNRRLGIILFLGLLTLVRWAWGQSADDILKQAVAAFTGGNHAQAIALAGQAIDKNPTNASAYMVRGNMLSKMHDRTNALKDFDSALKFNPGLTNVWQTRGMENFRLGKFSDSIRDFDHFIALRPTFAPYHWQRGISLYDAGRYEEGKKQFESHQTVNSNDVENAVWHFMCVARIQGIEKARAMLIPIKGDPRVPLAEIHALFAGTIQPEDVLKAARKGEPSTEELKQRLFYTHLYLGLYFEAVNDPVKSHEHLLKAANEYRPDDYMGDVAEVHLLVKQAKAAEAK